MTVRVRFAPSPTGFIHIGNVRTALFNYLFAKHAGGQFFLRIEDTDRERSKREYEEALKQDLSWLGLSWDETPLRQSERTSYYHDILERFKKQGNVYPCFCSQEELEAKRRKALLEKKPPRYDGTCRNLTEAEVRGKIESRIPFSYRFKIENPEVKFNDLIKGSVDVNLHEMVGDFVVARQDGSPLFHLTVCADDAAMNITHVIRGEDHLSNTPRHILIFQALGAKVPQFAHLPLILGEDGHPLSKRLGDFSIREFHRQGLPPEGVINYLALLGWSPGNNQEIMTREEMIRMFELSKVNSSPARFNHEKMRWVLHHHFQKFPPSDLVKEVRSFVLHESLAMYSQEETEERLAFLREGVASFSELGKQFDLVFGLRSEADLKGELEHLPKDINLQVISEKVKDVVTSAPGNYLGELSIFTDALKSLGLKGPGLFKPLRLLLTGSLNGPELKLLLPLTPRKLALQRIEMLEKIARS